jgi:hypothetical protein
MPQGFVHARIFREPGKHLWSLQEPACRRPRQHRLPHMGVARTDQHPQHDSVRHRRDPGERPNIARPSKVIVGAVTGSLRRPEVALCGLYRGRELEIVGRTVPLNPTQAAELAVYLKPAGVRHPWPDEIGPGHWGRGARKVAIVKVKPVVVAEVAADAAKQGDHYRHPLRFHRVRADLTPNDVDRLDAEAAELLRRDWPVAVCRSHS